MKITPNMMEEARIIGKFVSWLEVSNIGDEYDITLGDKTYSIKKTDVMLTKKNK